MKMQTAIPVSEASQIGEARRAASQMAEKAGLDDTHAGRVAIIATELASNLVKYGKNGLIVTCGESGGGVKTVWVLSVDNGPGFNAAACMEDGYSTGGSRGQGLGAVRRLASEFDYYTLADKGSVIYASVLEGAQGSRGSPVQCASIWICAPGELICGDDFGVSNSHDASAAFMIADGLGHGPEAAKASQAAVSVFDENPFCECAEMINTCHKKLAGTRGAAVAVANLDRARGVLSYAGVGNISGTLLSPGARRGLISHNGTVGSGVVKAKALDYPLANSTMLVMHSDGLQTRWSLEDYPGLAMRHAMVAAGVLFRDFRRGRDDATVLVAKWGQGA